MERLTERFGGRYIAIKGCLTAYKDEERKGAPAANAIVRLSAYEDTGLTLEDIDALKKREQGLAELLVNVSCGCAVSYTRLAELSQAEKDGRLVVLPCKKGDTLWGYYNYPTRGVRNTVVKAVSTINGITVISTDDYGVIPERDIGDTVFPTREEAEAALKKREADNEAD